MDEPLPISTWNQDFQDFPRLPWDSASPQAEQEEAKTREDTKIKALEGELVRGPIGPMGPMGSRAGIDSRGEEMWGVYHTPKTFPCYRSSLGICYLSSNIIQCYLMLVPMLIYHLLIQNYHLILSNGIIIQNMLSYVIIQYHHLISSTSNSIYL